MHHSHALRGLSHGLGQDLIFAKEWMEGTDDCCYVSGRLAIVYDVKPIVRYGF